MAHVRSTPASPSKQGLSWLLAALLVAFGGIGVALWLSNTAAKVDQDTLDRGSDAISANIEEQIRILALAGTGAQSLAGQALESDALAAMAGQIDISVLRSLLAIVTYPVTDDGVRPGDFIALDLQPVFDVPRIAVSPDEIATLLATGDAFLSPPVVTTDPDRRDYVALMPVVTDGELSLIGVVFRPDKMLRDAVDAAGEGQYAAVVTDPRYGDQVVVTIGEAIGGISALRSPSGLKGALQVMVRPGPDFPFSQSAWIPGLAVGLGLVVAALLVWMGKMARARADDLVEKLRLAEELNESKDRFLAAVSHELRTPLTVVLGVASEVGPNWDQFAHGERLELLGMMSEQAHEAANIVEDLLVAARSDPTKLQLAMEPTSVHPHLEYALASLPADALPRIKWSSAPQEVYADTTRLRQILRNLLENAVRYGGPNIEIRAWEDPAKVHICISDDGSTLGDDDIARIFEPYERSAAALNDIPSGVGIGLFVSRLLARRMGGDLYCARDKGWTQFHLWLPAQEHMPQRVAVGEFARF